MASVNLEVKIKPTEAFAIVLAIRNDLEECFHLIPDYHPEKAKLEKRLNESFQRFKELIEVEPI